jgi:hypothetical protein
MTGRWIFCTVLALTSGLAPRLVMVATAQSPKELSASPTHPVAATTDVAMITLIKASDGMAVIRSGDGRLEKIRPSDRIGTSRALVKEVSGGRLTLEETFTGKDGKPNRALIVIKEGERGGTRYLQRADEPGVVGTKPLILPAAPVAKPAPKKPPQM